jgi:excisionase family DNA binding protein
MRTGEVAALIGCSTRHVEHLCERGQLPYSLAGSHRRIRREDAERLMEGRSSSRGGPMTDDQIRLLWLHRLAAARIVLDPTGSLERVRVATVARLTEHPDGAQWLSQWLPIIERGPEAVMRVMTSTEPLARELRANSAFGILLSEDERAQALRSARSARLRQSAISGSPYTD